MSDKAIKITSRIFQYTDRIMVVPNQFRRKKDDAYIWKILALEGRDTGGVVGIATGLALTGPCGCIPSTRGVTGHIATQQMWLTNATHQADGVWSPHTVMDAVILTSEGEVWTVNRRQSPQARIRFWDKDFNEVDAPKQWKVISN